MHHLYLQTRCYIVCFGFRLSLPCLLYLNSELSKIYSNNRARKLSFIINSFARILLKKKNGSLFEHECAQDPALKTSWLMRAIENIHCGWRGGETILTDLFTGNFETRIQAFMKPTMAIKFVSAYILLEKKTWKSVKFLFRLCIWSINRSCRIGMTYNYDYAPCTSYSLDFIRDSFSSPTFFYMIFHKPLLESEWSFFFPLLFMSCRLSCFENQWKTDWIIHRRKIIQRQSISKKVRLL